MFGKSKKGVFLRRAALAGTALSFVALAPAFAAPGGTNTPNTSTWTAAASSAGGTTSISGSGTSGAGTFTVTGVGVTTPWTNANIVVTTGSDGVQIAQGQTLTLTVSSKGKAAANWAVGMSTLIVDNSGTASDINGALNYDVVGAYGGAAGDPGVNNLYIANPDGIMVGASGSINVDVSGSLNNVTYVSPSEIYLEGYDASGVGSGFNVNAANGALKIGNGTGNITIASGATFGGSVAGNSGIGLGSVIVAGAGSINIGTAGSSSAVTINNGGNFDVYAGLEDDGLTSVTPATGSLVTVDGAITTSAAANIYGQENVVGNSASNGGTGTLNIYAGYNTSGAISGSSNNVTLTGTTTVASLEATNNITTTAGSTVTAGGAGTTISAGGTFTNNSGTAGWLTLNNNTVTATGGFINPTGSQVEQVAQSTGNMSLNGALTNGGIFNIDGGANTTTTYIVDGNVTNSGLLRSVASNFGFTPSGSSVANTTMGLALILGSAEGIGGYNFVNTGTLNVAGYETGVGVINPNLSITAANIDLQGYLQANDGAAASPSPTTSSVSSATGTSNNADFGDLTLLATSGLSYQGGYSGINAGVIDFNTSNTVNVVDDANGSTNPGFTITAGAVRFLSGGLVDNGIAFSTSTSSQGNADEIITGSSNKLQDPFTGATLHNALSVFSGVSVTAGANDLLVDTQVDETNASGSVGNNHTHAGSSNSLIYTYGDVNVVGTLGSVGGNVTFVAGSVTSANGSRLNSGAGIEVGNGETLTFDFAGNLNNPNGPAENNSTWVYNYLPVSIGNTGGATGAINVVLNSVGAAGNYNSNPYLQGATSSGTNNYGPYGTLTPGGIGVGTNTNNSLKGAQLVNLMVNGTATVYSGDTGSASSPAEAADYSTSWGEDPIYGSSASAAYNSHLVVQATGNLIIGGSSNAAGYVNVSGITGVKNVTNMYVANYQALTPTVSYSYGGADTAYWPGLVYLRNAAAFSGPDVTSINAGQNGTGFIALDANLDDATYSTVPTAGGGNGITFASNNLVNLNYNFIEVAANGALTFTSQSLANVIATDFGQYVLQATPTTPGNLSWGQAGSTVYSTGNNL